MTDEPITETEKVLLGTDTWFLKVLSWQQSVHGVNKPGSGDHSGENWVDLKCLMERGLLQGDLLVGENLTENLADLPFTIQLRAAGRPFSRMNEKETTEDDETSMGFLVYYPPIPAEHLSGLPIRHIEESKTGTISGWVFFDDVALWKIIRSLSMPMQRASFFLSVTIPATAEANIRTFNLREAAKRANNVPLDWQAGACHSRCRPTQPE